MYQIDNCSAEGKREGSNRRHSVNIDLVTLTCVVADSKNTQLLVFLADVRRRPVPGWSWIRWAHLTTGTRSRYSCLFLLIPLSLFAFLVFLCFLFLFCVSKNDHEANLESNQLVCARYACTINSVICHQTLGQSDSNIRDSSVLEGKNYFEVVS